MQEANRFKQREKALTENTERVGTKKSSVKEVGEVQSASRTKPKETKREAITSTLKPKKVEKNKPEQEDGFILQGFYITDQQKKALGRLKYEEGINHSRAAREALDLYLRNKGMI